MTSEPTKFGVGGVWEDSEWRIEYDAEVDATLTVYEDGSHSAADERQCPHVTDIREDPPKVYFRDPEHPTIAPFTEVTTHWTVPRVVVATNEGGFNSTGVCLDCILDAAVSLFGATDWLVEFVEKLLDDWEGGERQVFHEYGVGEDERRSMEKEIKARRAEWKALKEDRLPVSQLPETPPVSD